MVRGTPLAGFLHTLNLSASLDDDVCSGEPNHHRTFHLSEVIIRDALFVRRSISGLVYLTSFRTSSYVVEY
jgi:hypothetical protein